MRRIEKERLMRIEQFVEEQREFNRRLDEKTDQMNRFVQSLTLTAIASITTMTVAIVVFIYNVIKN